MRQREPLELEWLPGRLAVCRLAPDAEVPAWAGSVALSCVVRTDRELSVIASADAVPAGVRAESPWRALRVKGTLDFALTGILARLTTALAEAGVPTFAVSTYDTDILLVRERDQDRAAEALTRVARIG